MLTTPEYKRELDDIIFNTPVLLDEYHRLNWLRTELCRCIAGIKEFGRFDYTKYGELPDSFRRERTYDLDDLHGETLKVQKLDELVDMARDTLRYKAYRILRKRCALELKP